MHSSLIRRCCSIWLMSAPTSTPSFSFNSLHNNSPLLLPWFFQSLGFQSLWLVQNVLLKIKVIVFAFLMQMLSHMAPPNAYEGQRWACEVISATEYSDTHHERIVMRPELPHPPMPCSLPVSLTVSHTGAVEISGGWHNYTFFKHSQLICWPIYWNI